MKNTTLITALLLLLSGFTYAQQTYVPDDDFENYLETHDANGNTVAVGNINSMGNGVVNDNYVPTSRVNSVINLDVHGLAIYDLTGIEDFTALQELNCNDNMLTNLNLTQNTALQKLLCHDNQITSLDVTQNTALIELLCTFNPITDLDVSHNPALQFIYCDDTQLTSLDVTQNTALQVLTCGQNLITGIDVTHNPDLQILFIEGAQFTSLDVSQNPALISLGCGYNQLTSLDVSQNPNLQYLNCVHNHLTSLEMQNGNNSILTGFNATQNPNLTCVYVDNSSYMNTNWAWAIDNTATYADPQNQCISLGIDENFNESIHIYPNPIDEYLSIQVPDKANIKSISIQNMQGQIVYQSNFAPQIKLANLPMGVYFLHIENKTGDKAVFKLIKD